MLNVIRDMVDDTTVHPGKCDWWQRPKVGEVRGQGREGVRQAGIGLSLVVFLSIGVPSSVSLSIRVPARNWHLRGSPLEMLLELTLHFGRDVTDDHVLHSNAQRRVSRHDDVKDRDVVRSEAGLEARGYEGIILDPPSKMDGFAQFR